MGTIIVKTNEGMDKDRGGAYIHIPEELWELSKKHKVYVDDSESGDKVLVIDLNQPAQSPTLRGKV